MACRGLDVGVGVGVVVVIFLQLFSAAPSDTWLTHIAGAEGAEGEEEDMVEGDGVRDGGEEDEGEGGWERKRQRREAG